MIHFKLMGSRNMVPKPDFDTHTCPHCSSSETAVSEKGFASDASGGSVFIETWKCSKCGKTYQNLYSLVPRSQLKHGLVDTMATGA